MRPIQSISNDVEVGRMSIPLIFLPKYCAGEGKHQGEAALVAKDILQQARMRATRLRCRFWTRCAVPRPELHCQTVRTLRSRFQKAPKMVRPCDCGAKARPGLVADLLGDALVTVMVRADPVFRREGDDILLTLPISFDEAILGGKVTVPTIDGPVGLTIPPAASTGTVLRLRGRGVLRAGRKVAGDQKVELKIVVSKQTDADLSEFLTEWRKTNSFDPRADLLKGAAV
jgi:hypothetical protein